MKSVKSLAIDIGNSRIKIFDADNSIFHLYDENQLDNLYHFILNNDYKHICISSVNLILFNKLSAFLDLHDIKYSNAIDLVNNYFKIDFSKVAEMGTDRKLGLIAAGTLFKAPFITIDFGTAITINIVNSESICEGGLIIPGLYTQSKALNHFTSALPLVEIHYSSELAAYDTISAINNGIINITLDGINAIINKLTNKYNTPEIIISGGGFEIIKHYPFDFKFLYEPKLVLIGILSLI